MAIFGSKAESRSESRSIDTVIGAEALFEGVLSTKNSVCIEGTFRGTLHSEGAVILSRSGTLEADVVADHVSVNGTLRGNVRALQQLDVGETGAIHGDVQAASVTVAKGGVLEGTCRRIPAEAPEGATLAEKREGGTLGFLRRKGYEEAPGDEKGDLAAEA
jgi:cytoskeletal protein CcmA (bactofilin family)